MNCGRYKINKNVKIGTIAKNRKRLQKSLEYTYMLGYTNIQSYKNINTMRITKYGALGMNIQLTVLRPLKSNESKGYTVVTISQNTTNTTNITNIAKPDQQYSNNLILQRVKNPLWFMTMNHFAV